MTGDYIIDGINMTANPDGPDHGPFREKWTKKHRVAYEEIPYFKDKTIVTSGIDPAKTVDGVDSGGSGSGTLWFLDMGIRSISEIRFQFLKAVADRVGPHLIIFPFGVFQMYLTEGSFEPDIGTRDGTTQDSHFIASREIKYREHIGTWNFQFVEMSD